MASEQRGGGACARDDAGGGRRGGAGRAARGQREGDPQPVRLVERGLGGPLVGGGDRGDDGQPEAGPGARRRRRGAVEAVEDMRELVGRDTGAVVADLDRDVAVALSGGDGGDGPAVGVGEHVGEQVVDGGTVATITAAERDGNVTVEIWARSAHPWTRPVRSTRSCCRSGCWSSRASRSMSSTSRLMRWASSAMRRIA